MTQKEASEKMPRLDKKKKKFPSWLSGKEPDWYP